MAHEPISPTLVNATRRFFLGGSCTISLSWIDSLVVLPSSTLVVLARAGDGSLRLRGLDGPELCEVTVGGGTEGTGNVDGATEGGRDTDTIDGVVTGVSAVDAEVVTGNE